MAIGKHGKRPSTLTRCGLRRKKRELSIRPDTESALTEDDLSALTGVLKSTLARKAKLIRDILRIGHLASEFCRRELLESNPMAWMISVNGFILDARMMPPRAHLGR